jgi:hypothetical protein
MVKGYCKIKRLKCREVFTCKKIAERIKAGFQARKKPRDWGWMVNLYLFTLLP